MLQRKRPPPDALPSLSSKQPRAGLERRRRRAAVENTTPSSHDDEAPSSRTTRSPTAAPEADADASTNTPPPSRPRRPLPSQAPTSARAPDPPLLLEKYEKQCVQFFQSWLTRLQNDGLSEKEMASTTSQSFQLLLQQAASTARAGAAGAGVAQPPLPGSLSLQLTQLVEQSSSQQPPASDLLPASRADLLPAASDDGPPVHIQLGHDPPPGPPQSLVEAVYRKIQDKGNKTDKRSDDAVARLRAAARLQARALPRVAADDLQAIGSVLLGDVFGAGGQKRLAKALAELYGDEADGALCRTLQGVADVAARAGAAGGPPGSTKLAAFASRLSDAVRHDAPPRTVADDIRMLHTKVELIREWERWSQPDPADRDIAAFLDGEGIPRETGVVLSSRITKYLVKTMGVPAGQLAKKIYAWRPLAVLEEVLGPGVFVLLVKSVSTSYIRLRRRGDEDTATKETKFRAIVAAVVDELPVLLDVCAACYNVVVRDVLASAPPLANLAVPGIRMAVEGDARLLHQTSICDLLDVVAIRRPLVGTVEELTDGEGSGADEDDDDDDGNDAFETRRHETRPSAR